MGKSQHKILTEAIRRTGHNPDICWIRSHPESRKADSNSWSTQEWGIFLADMLAEENFSHIEHLTGGFYRTPLASIMQELLIPGTWYWSNTNNSAFYDSIFGTTPFRKQSTRISCATRQISKRCRRDCGTAMGRDVLSSSKQMLEDASKDICPAEYSAETHIRQILEWPQSCKRVAWTGTT